MSHPLHNGNTTKMRPSYLSRKDIREIQEERTDMNIRIIQEIGYSYNNYGITVLIIDANISVA